MKMLLALLFLVFPFCALAAEALCTEDTTTAKVGVNKEEVRIPPPKKPAISPEMILRYGGKPPSVPQK
ncbi:MAG: hypothetical protein Q7S75_01260 [bacterium]|nr:hypothetical protein [bacterium]